MQIASRFTMAVHVLICTETFQDDYKITSEFLASSVNVNPVVIRRLLQQLKKAGIIEVKRGSGGTAICKNLYDVTLLDIYHAVEAVEDGQLFHFHEDPCQQCPVGKNIHKIMDGYLEDVQKAMEAKLRSITVYDIMERANKIIEM